MHRITKEFGFDFGHRVWSQTLMEDLSLSNKCVCRHLHGHRGTIIVELEGKELTNGMVTDFKHLNWFKKWIDLKIDHKFIIDRNDPLFNIITNMPRSGMYIGRIEGDRFDTFIHDGHTYTEKEAALLSEFYGSFVMVDFVPTSENLCQWFYDLINDRFSKIKELANVKVSSVVFKETPKTSCYYER